MKTLRILCFGDSLTEGYSHWGMVYTPYAKNLGAYLKAAFPETTFKIDVNGMSGDRVVDGLFFDRLEDSCSKVEDLYDWIIILGGTNDLGYGLRAEVIYEGLQCIYDAALDNSTNILALTVPECSAISKELDARRNKLNSMILEPKEGPHYTLDLHALMPYHSMTEESREQVWDDGLHFTPYGYGVMGDYIANRLVELLNMNGRYVKASELPELLEAQRKEKQAAETEGVKPSTETGESG